MVSNKKMYGLIYCAVSLIIIIVFTNIRLDGNAFFNIFMQEDKTIYYSDDIKLLANGYSIVGNDWNAENDDPNVLLKFGEQKNIDYINVNIESIKDEDLGQIYYTSSEEFEGDKYVQQMMKPGTNTFKFDGREEIKQLRLDLTSLSDNCFVLTDIEIKYETVSVNTYLATILLIWIIMLAFGLGLVCILKNRNNIVKYFEGDGRYYVFLFFIITLIFLILYGKYIWGDELYVFTDIGSDTFYGYLPYYENYLARIRSLKFDFFSLQYGIGTSSFAASSQCLDIPFVFILLLFKEAEIYQGLLLVTYIKYLFIAFFCMKLFIIKGYERKISMIVAVLWTYCGWNVLWGQHYWLLSGICYFTFLMYCLEAFFEKKKKYALMFVLTLGLYCSVNLYFAYSICACMGVYLFFSRIINHCEAKRILNQVLVYFVLVISALLIFAPIIYIQLELVMESSRMSTIFNSNIFDVSLKRIVVYLGRFISSDMLGVTNYSGANNLYEDPILATSLLLIPAILHWIRNSKARKIGVAVISAVVLFIPAINYIFSMSSANRWYFIIAFASVNVIAYMLRDIQEDKFILSRKGTIMMAGIYMVICAVLLLSHIYGVVNVNWYSMILKLIVFANIMVVLNLKNVKTNAKINVILFIAIVEIVIGNYNIICHRETISKEAMQNYICSEQRKLVDYVKSIDDTLYRIDVYDRGSMLSDSALNGYNGLNSYCSVNSSAYLNFLDKLDERDSAHGMSKDSNHVDISKYNYYLQTLLGTKYVISSEGAPIGYSLIKSENNVGLYLNDNYLNMGFAYDNVMDENEFETLSLSEKNLALYNYCYLNELEYDDAHESNIDMKTKKIKTRISVSDYTLEGGKISGICNGKQRSVLVELDDKSKSIEGTYDISFDLNVPETGVYAKLIAGNSKEGDIYESYRFLTASNKRYNVLIDVAEEIDYIKIIPVYMEDDNNVREYSFILDNIVVKKWDDLYMNYYISATKEIQDRTASEVKYEDDMFTVSYNNSTNNQQVFCIPVGYNKLWKAEVNGVRQKVFPVNDAFCGVYVEPGQNVIVLAYDAVNNYMICVSILGIIIFAVFSICVVKNGVKSI